jgi:ribonuclease HI
MTAWTAWFDGAFPYGHSAFGFVLKREGQTIKTGHGFVPLLSREETTNVAEYGGLIEALNCAAGQVAPGDTLMVCGDSQLVIRQMSGQYRVKSDNLKLYFQRAKTLVSQIEKIGVPVALVWIRREENTEADELSKAKGASA